MSFVFMVAFIHVRVLSFHEGPMPGARRRAGNGNGVRGDDVKRDGRNVSGPTGVGSPRWETYEQWRRHRVWCEGAGRRGVAVTSLGVSTKLLLSLIHI